MKKSIILSTILMSQILFASESNQQQVASQEKSMLIQIYTPCEQQTGQHPWPYENYQTLGPLAPCTSGDAKTCTQLRPIDENPYTLFSYNACQHVAFIEGGSDYWTGCEIPTYIHNFLVKNNFSAEKIPAMFLRCTNFNANITADPYENKAKCINRSELTEWPNSRYNVLGGLTSSPTGHPISPVGNPYYFNECEAVIYQNSPNESTTGGPGYYWTNCVPMPNSKNDYNNSINPTNFQCSNNPAVINPS